MKADLINIKSSYVFYFLYFSAVAYLVDTFWLPTTLRKSERGKIITLHECSMWCTAPKSFSKGAQKIFYKRNSRHSTQDNYFTTYARHYLLVLHIAYVRKIVKYSQMFKYSLQNHFWKKEELFSTIHIPMAVQKYYFMIHKQYVDL